MLNKCIHSLLKTILLQSLNNWFHTLKSNKCKVDCSPFLLISTSIEMFSCFYLLDWPTNSKVFLQKSNFKSLRKVANINCSVFFLLCKHFAFFTLSFVFLEVHKVKLVFTLRVLENLIVHIINGGPWFSRYSKFTQKMWGEIKL